MSTNSAIYQESVSLLERENDFVCLITSRPTFIIDEYFFREGMQIIACGAEAHRFPYAAMKLTVDPPDSLFLSLDESADNQPCRYIFCSDELPTFCRLLLKGLGKHSKGRYLRDTTIHIDIRNTWKE